MTNFNLTKHGAEGAPPTADQARGVCKRYAYLTEKLSGTSQITEESLRRTHRAVDAQAPARAVQKRPPVRTFWHALYYPEERRVKFSYYLRDEDVPGQPDKVYIAGPTTSSFASIPRRPLPPSPRRLRRSSSRTPRPPKQATPPSLSSKTPGRPCRSSVAA